MEYLQKKREKCLKTKFLDNYYERWLKLKTRIQRSEIVKKITIGSGRKTFNKKFNITTCTYHKKGKRSFSSNWYANSIS